MEVDLLVLISNLPVAISRRLTAEKIDDLSGSGHAASIPDGESRGAAHPEASAKADDPVGRLDLDWCKPPARRWGRDRPRRALRAAPVAGPAVKGSIPWKNFPSEGWVDSGDARPRGDPSRRGDYFIFLIRTSVPFTSASSATSRAVSVSPK